MRYSYDYYPRFRESGADGLVGVKGYVNYFEDVASGHFHSMDKGNDTIPKQYGVAWVYSKYKLKLYEKADFSEKLTISSWVSRCDRVRVWQEMEIRRGEALLCEGRLESCVMDLNHNRLSSPEVIELPDDLEEPTLTSVERFSRRQKCPEDAELRYIYTVRYTDLDNNRHMNNLHYVDMFLNAFDPTFFDQHFITDFELHYVSQSYYGEELKILLEKNSEIEYTLFAKKADGAIAAACVMQVKEI